MIEIKSFTKPKKQGSSGGSTSKTTYIQGTISEAEHASRADKAKRAEAADQASYADRAGTAANAVYATKAGEVSSDAEALQDFLRKSLVDKNEDGTDHWEEVLNRVDFENLVRFAKEISANGIANAGDLTNNGDLYNDGNLENEGDITNGGDMTNQGTLTTKNLIVTGLAHFFELVIDKVKSAGGAVVLTPCDGFEVEIVRTLRGSGGALAGYMLLWQCRDENGKQRDNMWRENDQALCMSFNQAKVGTSHEVTNKYYWALVAATSSNDSPMKVDDKYYHYIVLSADKNCYDGTLNPEEGDSIVMLGYRGTDDPERQSALYLSAYTSLDSGLKAPLFAQYRGINDFDLASHRKSYWDARGSKVIGDFEVSSGESLEDYIHSQVGEGQKGEKGDKGDKGDKGEDGAPGAPGAPGNSAVSWKVVLTRGSNGITQGLYVNVVRSIGYSIVNGTIKSFGLDCTAYVDGVVSSGLTSRLKNTDSYIDFSAFPGAKSFSIAIYDDSTLLATGNYAMGADAYRVEVSPSALIFDTADSGIVTSYPSSKRATIRVYQGSEDVSKRFNRDDRKPSNYANCNGEIVDLNTSPLQVRVTSIDTDSDTKTTKTNGFLEFSLTDGSSTVIAHVDVQVNVAKFTGGLLATNKKFQTVYNELTNNGTDESLTDFYSKIEQTSREISLKVGQNAVERNNMLVGSAFRKQDDGYVNNGTDDYQYIICSDYAALGGYNAIKVLGQDSQTFDGVSFRNIHVNGGATYSISCMAKRVSDTFGTGGCILIVHQMSKPNGDIIIQPSFTLLDTSDARGIWVEKKFTLTLNANARYVNVIFCVVTSGEFYLAKPMMAQGDGKDMVWSMSKLDYDYIGGNLLEGTKLMQAIANKITLYGTRTLVDSANGIYGVSGKAAASQTYGRLCRFNNVSVKAGKDYMLSMYVKRTRGGALGQLLISMASNVKYYERWDGGNTQFSVWGGGGGNGTYSGYIGVPNIPTEWTRIWIHYQFINDNDAQSIEINFYSDVATDGIDGMVKQIKFEEGATMTDWTENSGDMVSKQALLDTGIDIQNKKVTVTADNFIVQNNSGKQTAMIDGNGKLNADLIEAKVLKTYSEEGSSVEIEKGMISVFGLTGICNIRFGINDAGMAVLSYYDNSGNKLYDLGPGGIDAGQLSSAKLTSTLYVFAKTKFRTEDIYDNDTFYGNRSLSVVKGLYATTIFGSAMLADGDEEIKKNDSAHAGRQPFATGVASTTIYQYTAARLNGQIVKDDGHGLTADLAKQADGKYFTSSTMVSGGTLANLASGLCFLKTAMVSRAPYPLVLDDKNTYKWPAYSIRMVLFENGKISSVGTGLLYSTIMMTIGGDKLYEN